MLALQRCELRRLHVIVDELRAKPDAGDLASKLLAAQKEASRQRRRADMWRERAAS